MARGLAMGTFAIAMVAVPTLAGAQSIVGFSIDPAAPSTGDRIVLSATISLPENCGWTTSAHASYGEQPPPGPSPGWGIDLALRAETFPCVPGTIAINVAHDLGLLPVVSAQGVLRLLQNDVVVDSAPFSLTVRAGAAPGWEQPTEHGGPVLLVQAAGLTSIGGGLLAISDLLHREIVLFDPIQEIVTRTIRSPGSGNVRGLAWDGTDLYASTPDAVGPRVYKIDVTGRVLDFFASPVVLPGSQPLQGLAYRNGILYGSYDSPPLLFAINPVTHQKLWQRSLPVQMPGLDATPQGLLGVDPGGVFYFVEPDPLGIDVVLGDPVDTGLPGIAGFSGLAFDGIGMWAWDGGNGKLWRVRTFALWWSPDGTLRAYAPPQGSSVAVVRGDLSSYTQLSASVDLGPTVCLIPDAQTGIVDDGAVPAPGHGFFYLARFFGTAGFDTSYGRSSAGFRRIAGAGACP
jgi:hypothetical protein